MTYRWNKKGIPHKGWRYLSIEDLGEPIETCQMCGHEEIRYVHHLEHPDYGRLAVGCICAGKMTDDYIGPKKREESLKNKASRKSRWLKRKWKKSAKGNHYIKTEGILVTIFRQNLYWKYCVSEDMVNKEFSRERYKTCDEAKLASFEKFWEKLEESL
jgi:hypothetical protein